jgi:hypothetical protein
MNVSGEAPAEPQSGDADGALRVTNASAEMSEIPKDADAPVAKLHDRALWQFCRFVEVPEDADQRQLDLAAFADGSLDPDDRERIAELLRADPEAAADVAAARTLASMVDEEAPEIAHIVARAIALRPADLPRPGRVVPFSGPRQSMRLHGLAQWASLAAAVAIAAWLGFAMGSDASLALRQPALNGDDGAAIELFDPATGFLHDTSAGSQT